MSYSSRKGEKIILTDLIILSCNCVCLLQENAARQPAMITIWHLETFRVYGSRRTFGELSAEVESGPSQSDLQSDEDDDDTLSAGAPSSADADSNTRL